MDDKINIVLVALYQYQNTTVRSLHALLEDIDGVRVSTIFFKNCETNILKLPTNREKRLFVELITGLKPALVGFSVLSPYTPVAGQLTKLIKDNSSSPVIWGGIHPTISPEDCISRADMICVGEGDGAITDLARNLRDKKPYNKIDNLWINNNGKIIKNPMRPLMEDLDSLPFPSYKRDSYYFIDSNRIAKEDPLLLDDYFWVQASRGCPYVCTYCANSFLQKLFKGLGPYYRRRSVETLIKEIEKKLSLWKGKVSEVLFNDEIFGVEESWLNEFELQYKKRIGIPFMVQYHPQLVNPVMLDKLVNAGLNMINVGIQTGSDDIRNKIFNRSGKNEDILNMAKSITARGIKIKYDLILNNPYETTQSLKNTIAFLLQLPKPLLFNLFSLQYFPNYSLTKKVIGDGHVRPEEIKPQKLFNNITKNWAYTASLLPYTEEHLFQNLIWLVVWRHEKDDIVNFAVFGDSFGSRVCRHYLNIKSIVLSKLFGMGGIMPKIRNSWVAYLINGLRYILKGDLKTLFRKILKHTLHRGSLGEMR